MSFINKEDNDNLVLLSRLRSKKYKKNGKEYYGKLFLVGSNKIKLSGIKLREAKTGKYFIVCEFTRDNQKIQELKTPVIFAPHDEYIFGYELANEICTAFGHELKPMPDDYDFNAYMTAVARRIRTFVGRECYCVAWYEKEARTDEYGHVEQRRIGVKNTEDITDYRLRCIYSKEEQKADWEEICYKTSCVNEK